MKTARAQQEAHANWEALLFPLHAATEVEELGRATLPLLRAAFAPAVRATLFLGHFGMREARRVFTDPPIEGTTEWFKERGRINPFTAHINTHRRATHYRFRDVLGTVEKFKATEFYLRFARAEGWTDGMSGLFWKGDEVKAMFSVYRAPGGPEFGPAEVARLKALRPHLETAIDRVMLLHTERLYRKVLEEFNRYIPLGLMLLDWELEPVFANTEAVKECAVWCHGPKIARGLISRDRLEVPPPIKAACERIRDEILNANAKDRPVFSHPLERLAHPHLPDRLAAVSAVNASAGLLAKPGFLVVLEDRSLERQPRAHVAVEKQRLLWVLTPSEREVALLICEGCSNAEVSRRLKKSLLTTKKQVTSIFAKLNVRSRGRLMALLR
ncbi:helix-turn-helix transcriptional regulator [Horticoccus sp. 23ND18S-11]|uniref:helix-turn-helix transcriptional regulator n=1 Tax=Horticoccus sp. 23ND18S-11 TaxID=3391832 RepID=UPI0039C96E62